MENRFDLTGSSPDRLARIVREAGAAILTRARAGVTAMLKADESPVTEADCAAHHSSEMFETHSHGRYR